jgi:two-component system chemotaxis response regulator CheB
VTSGDSASNEDGGSFRATHEPARADRTGPECTRQPGRDIVVIGASAGGVAALKQIVSRLPADLPAALFVVLHVPADAPSALPEILQRSGPLPALHAEHGALIEHGRIYVAPPDNHLLVRRGHVQVVRGPRENRHRPAVDPLFRSAALAYGPRVVGVVISGALDDGTAGLLAIKQRGGITVVQNPDTALHSGMPESALAHVPIDHCLAPEAIGPLLRTLASVPAPVYRLGSAEPTMEREIAISDMDIRELQRPDRPGTPSGFSCPECDGTLWELSEGDLIRFRCRVGHAYTAGSLLAEQDDALESALWAALRALEERASLARRLLARAEHSGHTLAAAQFGQQVADAEHRANTIRRVLVNGTTERREPPNP